MTSVSGCGLSVPKNAANGIPDLDPRTEEKCEVPETIGVDPRKSAVEHRFLLVACAEKHADLVSNHKESQQGVAKTLSE